jgi:hypothetical protein
MVCIKTYYNILVGKPERKEPVGEPVCRWEDNIKTNIKEMVYVDVY